MTVKPPTAAVYGAFAGLLVDVHGASTYVSNLFFGIPPGIPGIALIVGLLVAPRRELRQFGIGVAFTVLASVALYLAVYQ